MSAVGRWPMSAVATWSAECLRCRGQFFGISIHQPAVSCVCGMTVHRPIWAAHLEAARKRIAELEAERDDLFARGNLLSDTSGLLETEKRELLVENATLRRTIERIERDAKRGRR